MMDWSILLFALPFLLLCNSVAAFAPKTIQQRIFVKQSSTTFLNGGYDATIGADPNTPIQVYCTFQKSKEEALAIICLAELGLPFQTIEIMNPKPDWFLRIHPSGTTPALRNPADTEEIIHNSSPEEDQVVDYICSVHETLSTEPCPFVPKNLIEKRKMNDLQNEFYSTVLPKCISYLENKAADTDEARKQEMEGALLTFFDDSITKTPGWYLLGESFTSLDAAILLAIRPMLATLKDSKDYELPKKSCPRLVSWLEQCNHRASVKCLGD